MRKCKAFPLPGIVMILCLLLVSQGCKEPQTSNLDGTSYESGVIQPEAPIDPTLSSRKVENIISLKIASKTNNQTAFALVIRDSEDKCHVGYVYSNSGDQPDAFFIEDAKDLIWLEDIEAEQLVFHVPKGFDYNNL